MNLHWNWVALRNFWIALSEWRCLLESGDDFHGSHEVSNVPWGESHSQNTRNHCSSCIVSWLRYDQLGHPSTNLKKYQQNFLKELSQTEILSIFGVLKKCSQIQRSQMAKFRMYRKNVSQTTHTKLSFFRNFTQTYLLHDLKICKF